MPENQKIADSHFTYYYFFISVFQNTSLTKIWIASKKSLPSEALKIYILPLCKRLIE